MAIPSSFSQRAPTHQLATKVLFDNLAQRNILYAHHLSRASWHGTRIILRQTSPEGPESFNSILELHKACGGEWNSLADQGCDSRDELNDFLEFSGLFLSNLGSYFVNNLYPSLPHHFLTVHRVRETGRLFLIFLLLLFGRWQASRQRPPLF